MSSQPKIHLDRVAKTYPGSRIPAVDELTLDVQEGEILVLVGPSGCGKSTTLRLINRMIEPSSGRIMLDGEDVTKANPDKLRRRIGYVIQQIGLFPHQTISQNIATVPKMLGWEKERIHERTEQLLTTVGLDPEQYRDRYPKELSGGQAQRVGVARALGADPDIMLMDEAFSALDPLIRTDMQDILLDLQEELHKTIVFITHDLDEALRIGDRISILRDGEIVQQGDPQDIIMRPADAYISDFIKDINRGRVIEVRSVMTRSSRASGPKLTADTPIEDALQMMSGAGKDSGVVVDGKGKTIGKIQLNDAIAAIARPERGKGTPRYK